MVFLFSDSATHSEVTLQTDIVGDVLWSTVHSSAAVPFLCRLSCSGTWLGPPSIDLSIFFCRLPSPSSAHLHVTAPPPPQSTYMSRPEHFWQTHSAPLPSAVQHKTPRLDETNPPLPCLSPPGLILSHHCSNVLLYLLWKEFSPILPSPNCPFHCGWSEEACTYIYFTCSHLTCFLFWLVSDGFSAISPESQLAKVVRYFMLDVTVIFSLCPALFCSDIHTRVVWPLLLALFWGLLLCYPASK